MQHSFDHRQIPERAETQGPCGLASANCPALCMPLRTGPWQLGIGCLAGAHVSMGGGIERAVINAASIGMHLHIPLQLAEHRQHCSRRLSPWQAALLSHQQAEP